MATDRTGTDERDTDDRPSADDSQLVSRRTALGGLTLGAGVSGYVVHRNRTDSRSRTDDPTTLGLSMPREGDIDERIETYRTAALTVIVLDDQGSPIPDADVEVTMQRHAFGFGTAVNATYLLEDADDRYRSAISELFNKAVLENHHKWKFWEIPEQRDRAEAATEWLLEHGLEMRGHTCIWQKRDQSAIPDDVVDAIDDEDGEYIATRAESHIRDIVGYYSDVSGLTEWDVLNEQTEEHELSTIIDPGSSPTDSPITAEWYRIAAEADPGAQLYINEYSILSGDRTDHRDEFERLVEYLLEQNAPLEGIGLQGHHWNPDHRRTPTELLETLDRFAALVPSIQIHEYDTWGDGWTETMEAEYLYTVLKTVFSHPAVEGFLMWGFWDEIHWHENAPLFRSDWSKKPAYDVYTGLVFDEWWTDERGRTDDDGVFRTTAILGEYEITASADGATATTTVSLAEPADRTTVLSIGGIDG